MLKFLGWLDGGHWHIHLSCPGLTIVTFFFQMRPNPLKKLQKIQTRLPVLFMVDKWMEMM